MKNKFKLFTRLIIIKVLKNSKFDLILQTLFFKMFNIIKIINLFEIKYKNYYIINIKRVAKDNKVKRLKKKLFYY